MVGYSIIENLGCFIIYAAQLKLFLRNLFGVPRGEKLAFFCLTSVAFAVRSLIV